MLLVYVREWFQNSFFKVWFWNFQNPFFKDWLVPGWVLVGSWLVLGWFLDGSWLVPGWFLVGPMGGPK